MSVQKHKKSILYTSGISHAVPELSGEEEFGKVVAEGDLRPLGTYPWNFFLCRRSEAGSHESNMQSSESKQINGLSPVLINRMH